MEYTTLGDSRTAVNRTCLGCMSFGSSDWREWVLDPGESRPVIDPAIGLGVTVFDVTRTRSVLVVAGRSPATSRAYIRGARASASSAAPWLGATASGPSSRRRTSG